MKPGTQKLTPPSSARELVAMETTTAPAIGNATTLAATFRRTNDEHQNFSVKNQDRAPFATFISRPYDTIFFDHTRRGMADYIQAFAGELNSAVMWPSCHKCDSCEVFR
ncbi:MAG: hypothetical protein WB489_16360 [Pseudolabrys sp.]